MLYGYCQYSTIGKSFHHVECCYMFIDRHVNGMGSIRNTELLNILRKHLGFALLMAFVMGWGSVATAQQNMMHEQMMMSHLQTDAEQTEQTSKVSDLQQTMSDCHQALPNVHHASQASKNVAHCAEMLKSSQSSGESFDHHSVMKTMDCQDCALWHCQIGATYVDAALILLQALRINSYSDTPKFVFNGQHLKGHWQEILRPPQI